MRLHDWRPSRTLSPLAYAGGKSWLVPRTDAWLDSLGSVATLCEPFAGGAHVGIAALVHERCQRLLLIELDPLVASFWQAVVQGLGPSLAWDVTLLPDNVALRTFRDGGSTRGDALQALVQVRTHFGGGQLHGRPRNVGRRWYPRRHAAQLLRLHALRQRITAINADGLAWLDDTTATAFFVDPPYMLAGPTMYAYAAVSFPTLFERLADLTAPFLLTCEAIDPMIHLAAHHGLRWTRLGMRDSHNRHRHELLVSRDLGWLAA